MVLSAIPYCGDCYYCSLGAFVQCDNTALVMGQGTMPDGTCRLRKNGTSLHHMVGYPAWRNILWWPSALGITLSPEVSLQTACLVGCGVVTGVGAAINTASVAADSSAVIAVAAAHEARVTLPAASFLGEKILEVSAYGSSRPRVDLPPLIDLYARKKLKLDELVTRTYPLNEVNQAMTTLERGEVIRSVVADVRGARIQNVTSAHFLQNSTQRTR
jgi:Zn-dependent alcohol dehydrogenase